MGYDIVGHKQVLDFFDTVTNNGRRSHAYCLVGPSNIGKLAVAQEIAARTFGISRDKLHTMPDYRLVQREINQKTGKLRKDISVDQIKALRLQLMSRPLLKEHTIAIIDHAERMSAGAANALLKTLEEPAEHSLLLLTTTDETLLPITIQSRCQMVYLNPIPDKELTAFLKTQQIDSLRAQDYIDHAFGKVGNVMSWLEDDDAFATHKDKHEQFQTLLGKPLYKKLAIVDELFGNKTDHIAAREHLQQVMQIWELEIHNTILGKSNHEEKWNAQQLVAAREKIVQAHTLLQQNIHPRLLVEHILLALP